MSTHPRCPLVVHVFETSSTRLGEHLYDVLTRPSTRHASRGLGLPVRFGHPPDRLDLEEGERHVLVVGLPGSEVVLGAVGRAEASQIAQGWLEGRATGETAMPAAPVEVLVVGVPWNGEVLTDEAEVAVLAACLRQLTEQAVPVVRLPEDGALPGQTEADVPLARWVGTLFQAVTGPTHPAAGAVLLVDLQGSPSPQLTTELLAAARRGDPVVVVDGRPFGSRQLDLLDHAWVLRGRASPVERARALLQESVRNSYFRLRAGALVGGAFPGLHPCLRSRPPTAMSLPLASEPPELVVYPGPPLHREVTERLLAQRPGMRFATPESVHQDVLSTEPQVLAGWRVAMSVSSQVDGLDGLHTRHMVDAIVAVGRVLMELGAQLVYGGDLRSDLLGTGAPGYTRLLGDVIAEHDASGASPLPRMLNVVPAASRGVELTAAALEEARRDYGAFIDFEVAPKPGDLRGLSVREVDAAILDALRRTLQDRLDEAAGGAAVLIGGKLKRSTSGPAGHSGLIPGLLQELWLTLKGGRPAYLIGAFGGSTEALGRALMFGEDAELLQAIGGGPGSDEPWPERDGGGTAKVRPLPSRDPAVVLQSLHGLARWPAGPDPEARWTNGLSVAENRRLLVTRDPDEIAGLIALGLRRVRSERRVRDPRVAVMVGDLADAARWADAVLLPLVRGMPLREGLGAPEDSLTQDVMALLDGGQFDAAATGPGVRMHLTDTGPVVVSFPVADDLLDPQAAPQRRALIADVLTVCAQRGLRRLVAGPVPGDPDGVQWIEALSAPGGTLAAALGPAGARRWAVELLVCALDEVGEEALLRERASLPHLRPFEPPVTGSTVAASALHLLSLRSLSSGAVESWLRAPRGAAQVGKVSSGAGFDLDREANRGLNATALAAREGRSDPGQFRALKRLGVGLADGLRLGMLRSGGLVPIRARRGEALEVVVDERTDGLPIELLGPQDTTRSAAVALRVPVVRRRLVTATEGRRFQAPRRSGMPLRVLVVVSPAGGHGSMWAEADHVTFALSRLPDVEARTLWPDAVGGLTAARIVAEVERFKPDVLHLIGHGVHDRPSTFVLPGGAVFEGKDLQGCVHVPRLVVLNLCASVGESAHVQTGGLASTWLDAGVACLIGTRVPVRDADATVFGVVLHGMIATGQTVGRAVLAARRAVRAHGSAGWAAWVQYGGTELILLPDPRGPQKESVVLATWRTLGGLYDKLERLSATVDMRQIIVVSPHVNLKLYAHLRTMDNTEIGRVHAKGDAESWSEESWVLTSGMPSGQHNLVLLAGPEDEEPAQGGETTKKVTITWELVSDDDSMPSGNVYWEMWTLEEGEPGERCAFCVQDGDTRVIIGRWASSTEGLHFRPTSNATTFVNQLENYLGNPANQTAWRWTEEWE